MGSLTGISSKFQKVQRKIIHSREFKKVLALAKGKREEVLKNIFHAEPLLVFWVTPAGKILDAGEAHRDNPPEGDKSVFTDSKYKGHLRGRAALIGSVVYIMIYRPVGEENLTNAQFSLLRRTYPGILEKLVQGHSDLTKKIQDAIFIEDDGETIPI